ncbi:MAG: hypothetical protein ACPLX8_02120, partial [Nanopusillaceae archaeon]
TDYKNSMFWKYGDLNYYKKIFEKYLKSLYRGLENGSTNINDFSRIFMGYSLIKSTVENYDKVIKKADILISPYHIFGYLFIRAKYVIEYLFERKIMEEHWSMYVIFDFNKMYITDMESGLLFRIKDIEDFMAKGYEIYGI